MVRRMRAAAVATLGLAALALTTAGPPAVAGGPAAARPPRAWRFRRTSRPTCRSRRRAAGGDRRRRAVERPPARVRLRRGRPQLGGRVLRRPRVRRRDRLGAARRPSPHHDRGPEPRPQPERDVPRHRGHDALAARGAGADPAGAGRLGEARCAARGTGARDARPHRPAGVLAAHRARERGRSAGGRRTARGPRPCRAAARAPLSTVRAAWASRPRWPTRSPGRAGNLWLTVTRRAHRGTLRGRLAAV